MTLRSRPVKKKNFFSPFYKKLTTQNGHLSLFSKDDSKYRNRADLADLNRGKKVIWGGVGRENTASVDGTISIPTLQ